MWLLSIFDIKYDWYKNKNIENTWLKMNSKVKKNQTEKELDIEKSGKLKLSFNFATFVGF